MNPIYTLAIDTSCDDTSVAILENDCVLSSVISSQIDVHKEWGGVVPNLARQAHEEMIGPCVKKALKQARLKDVSEVDAIAVTYGPGLAPALEVGVKFAREIAKEFDKKLVAVNHMEGHVLSPLLKNKKGDYFNKLESPEFPLLALTVSGGHTEIIKVNKIGGYEIIGQTLDDAAGEAFDKISRMLDLGYPGGQIIEKMAEKGNPSKYDLPRPMARSNDYNYSFSGLKTACLYSIQDLKKELGTKFHEIIPDYCASIQEAIIDSLLIKLLKAIKDHRPRMVFIGGGVSANKYFRKKTRLALKEVNIQGYFPDKKFTMDNAAMIGIVAFYKYKRKEFVKDISSLDRRPSITIESKNEFE